MTRDDIFTKVRDILMDELALDEDEIKSDSSLVKNLGAESIDFLAIVFKLEQAFGFKIAQGELFPENVMSDPRFVRDGKVTAEGLTALKARLPHVNFAKFEADPQVAKVAEVFTVDTLVSFVAKKLGV